LRRPSERLTQDRLVAVARDTRHTDARGPRDGHFPAHEVRTLKPAGRVRGDGVDSRLRGSHAEYGGGSHGRKAHKLPIPIEEEGEGDLILPTRGGRGPGNLLAHERVRGVRKDARQLKRLRALRFLRHDDRRARQLRVPANIHREHVDGVCAGLLWGVVQHPALGVVRDAQLEKFSVPIDEEPVSRAAAAPFDAGRPRRDRAEGNAWAVRGDGDDAQGREDDDASTVRRANTRAVPRERDQAVGSGFLRRVAVDRRPRRWLVCDELRIVVEEEGAFGGIAPARHRDVPNDLLPDLSLRLMRVRLDRAYAEGIGRGREGNEEQ